jgi:hypothetical protein
MRLAEGQEKDEDQKNCFANQDRGLRQHEKAPQDEQ